MVKKITFSDNIYFVRWTPSFQSMEIMSLAQNLGISKTFILYVYMFIFSYFSSEEEIDKAEDDRGNTAVDGEGGAAGAYVNKPTKEFSEVSVEVISEKLFLITGEDQVFILNDGTSYSRQLSLPEIKELEIHILWNQKVVLACSKCLKLKKY